MHASDSPTLQPSRRNGRFLPGWNPERERSALTARSSSPAVAAVQVSYRALAVLSFAALVAFLLVPRGAIDGIARALFSSAPLHVSLSGCNTSSSADTTCLWDGELNDMLRSVRDWRIAGPQGECVLEANATLTPNRLERTIRLAGYTHSPTGGRCVGGRDACLLCPQLRFAVRWLDSNAHELAYTDVEASAGARRPLQGPELCVERSVRYFELFFAFNATGPRAYAQMQLVAQCV